jgi:hypothetical protein
MLTVSVVVCLNTDASRDLLLCPQLNLELLPGVSIGVDRRTGVLVHEHADNSVHIMGVQRGSEGLSQLDTAWRVIPLVAGRHD